MKFDLKWLNNAFFTNKAFPKPLHIQFPPCYGFKTCHARVWLSYRGTISEYSMRGSWIVMFAERVRNKSTDKKSGIHLGFEPKTFWILVRSSLPLSHLDPWQRSGSRGSLVPRPLPDFILQLWRIWEWPGAEVEERKTGYISLSQTPTSTLWMRWLLFILIFLPPTEKYGYYKINFRMRICTM